MAICESSNTVAQDQSAFWDSNGIHWDAHRIGWAISGGCAALTVIITFLSVLSHARNYTVRDEQRQIIRILYMPPVYAVISFFSYRYFRSYTYYSLIEVVYEAVTLSAFLLLLIQYVAKTGSGQDVNAALARKDKTSLPFPFCCWRYRPTKAYFMYTIKWSVLQYVVVRPAVSVAAIICQHYNVLCEDAGFLKFNHAYPYLEIVDFISISVALYGLFVFYVLMKDELADRRPLPKFLCIKLIVMFTFYQSFVFNLLEGRVIKPTQYWTATNIADGLTALTICIEMVFFALFFWWSYPAGEYKTISEGGYETARPKQGNAFQAIIDSLNFWDFVQHILASFKFFGEYVTGKEVAHGHGHLKTRKTFESTFGLNGQYNISEVSMKERRHRPSEDEMLPK